MEPTKQRLGHLSPSLNRLPERALALIAWESADTEGLFQLTLTRKVPNERQRPGKEHSPRAPRFPGS